MLPRLLTTAAVSLATVPIALGMLLLRGRYLQQLALDLNPFEIDLQLHERNDD